MKRLLSRKLNKSLMHTCTSRIDPPPANPCSARPPINTAMVRAAAHKAELAKKMAQQTSMMILRPQISESLAQMGPLAALARRYAPPIQV